MDACLRKATWKKTWLSKNKTNSYRIPLCSVSMFINHPKVDTVPGPLASHFGIACSALMPPRWLILLSSLHHSVDRDFQMIVPLVWSRWQWKPEPGRSRSKQVFWCLPWQAGFLMVFTRLICDSSNKKYKQHRISTSLTMIIGTFGKCAVKDSDNLCMLMCWC